MVNVTDVRVRRINQEGRMKAIVSVTIDDAFVIHDVKVVEGQSGLFVAMPSRKMPDGDYRDIAHPINSEARAAIQQFVLEAYDRALAELEEEFAEEEVGGASEPEEPAAEKEAPPAAPEEPAAEEEAPPADPEEPAAEEEVPPADPEEPAEEEVAPDAPAGPEEEEKADPTE